MHYVNIYLNIVGILISYKKAKYYFQPIPTPNIKEPVLYKLFYAWKNGKSEARDAFLALSENEQDEVLSLIENMLTRGERYYIRTKIRWKLKSYKYGEIKTQQNRFFFFKVINKNLVFFGYDYKDQKSLGNERYKQLNQKYLEYEKEFKRKKD